MRLTLARKIAILVVGLTLTATIFLTYELDRTLAKEELSQLNYRLSATAGRLEYRILGYVDTLRLITNGSEANSLARSLIANGFDPSEVREAKSQLAKMFRTLISTRAEYAQLRFIEASAAGRELVRLDRVGENIIERTEAELQDKGDRQYFIATKQTKPNGIYVSDVDYNYETGQLSDLNYPTVRMASPVYAGSKIAGIIVLNLYAEALFSDLIDSSDDEGPVFITNNRGEFLHYPTNEEAHYPGRQEHRLGVEYPETGSFLASDEPFSAIRLGGAHSGFVMNLVRAPFDPFNHNRNIVYAELLPETVALEASKSQRKLAILLIIASTTLGLLLTYFLARQWTSSLRKMTERARNISGYPTNFDFSEDEIAVLDQSFNRMLEQLTKREEQVRLSTRRLRLALAVAHLDIWRINLEEMTIQSLEIEETSQQLQPKTSMSIGDFSLCLAPEDRSQFEAMLDDAVHYDTIGERILRLIDDDSRYRWIEFRVQKKSAESPHHLIAVGHDLTEYMSTRKELRDTSDNLRQTAATLRGIMDSSSDLIAAVDTNYRLTAFNHAFQMQLSNLIHRPVELGEDIREWNTLLPGEGDMMTSHWQRALEGASFTLNEKFPDENGDQLVFELVFAPILDISGDIVGASHMMRNRTDKARAEQELRENEERLNLIIENVADAVITIDECGTIESVNHVGESMFGYHRSELIGENVTVLMPEPYASQHDNYINRYIETNRPHIIGHGAREVVGLRRTGTVFPLELSVSETHLEGGRRFFIGILRDIEERRQQDEMLMQAQKMEAVGQLTGGVAHDFNNLLTVVMGNLRLLQDEIAGGGPSGDINDLIDDALSAAQDGADLTRALLAFSRKQSLAPQPIVINKQLQELKRFMTRSLGEDISIIYRLNDDVGKIDADPRQLENALLNLVINARDAMAGGGEIAISTRRYSFNDIERLSHSELDPGDYVAITISDSGGGMSEETVTRAIEPFYTTKSTGKGSGLGLSMVFGFVQQSGGGLDIRSEIGEGTAITLYLPATEREQDDHTADNESHHASEKRCSILVVEDENRVRRLAIRLLNQLGHDTTEAETAVRAQHLLQNGLKVDLVFSDVVMPGGMSGYQLADWIAANRPGLPILLTSGFSREKGQIVTATHHNPNIPLLPKPYSKTQLANWLDEILGRDGEKC